MGILNRWLGIPELASEHGEMVDHMLEVVHWFMLILFVFWTAFFFIAIFRFYHRRNPKAKYAGMTSHFSTHLEVGVIIVEVILLIGFAYPLWATRARGFPVGDDVAKVRAVGEQFKWTFHYPGPDGKFARVDADLITPENPAGIDREDPNGKDDFFTVNSLMLPLGRNCIIQVTSKDVIHCLALHHVRSMMDAIPGMEIPMWFKPTKKIEDGEIICAQLCGIGHASMIAYYNVVAAEEFDAWVKDNSPVKDAPEAPAVASSE